MTSFLVESDSSQEINFTLWESLYLDSFCGFFLFCYKVDSSAVIVLVSFWELSVLFNLDSNLLVLNFKVI